MRSMARYVLFGGLALPGFIVAVACSNGETAVTILERDAGVDDASRSLPPAGDASLDAPDSDSDDAANGDSGVPRTCSNDGFCHTVLPAEQTVLAIWGDGTGIVWAVSDLGNVLRWDGQAWSTQSSGKGVLYAIWGSAPTDLWIAGDGGLFHGEGTSSAAIVWTAVSLPGNPAIPIRSIWGSGVHDVWAVGGVEDIYNGLDRASRVLHYEGASDEAGPVWQLDPISNEPITVSAVWGSSATDVWLGAANGITNWYDRRVDVYRRSPDGDGGSSFTLVERPAITLGTSIAGCMGGAAFTNDSWWVLERSNLDRSCVWHAPNTQPASTPAWESFCDFDYGPVFRAIGKTGNGELWVAGDDGFLRRWTGKSLAQAQITIDGKPVTRALRGLWGQDGNELWVVGQNIALHRAKTSGGAKP